MLISDGALTPMPAVGFADSSPMYSNPYYYPTAGIGLADAFATYAAVYRSQVWVSTLVNKLAYGTARLPLKVYSRSRDGARSEARDTPFGKLLRNPNTRHDSFFFWLWTASTFEVYGEAMWVKIRPRAGAAPTQLWPLHPSNVVTRRDPETGQLVYEYFVGAANAPLMQWPEGDVVHFKSYNPDNQIRGMSRLEPLRQTILNEDASRKASQAFWSNGGRPSMALTHPSLLSPEAADRLKASWDSKHSGMSNWGKTAILEEGMTPHVFPLNAEEMQYIESRKINREEACGIYDVPPPVVHILDRATFSNITEQMRSMYRDTMAPRLGLFESVLDTQLRPDFDPQGNLYAEFLMDEVLRGSFEERVNAYEVMSRIGGMMPSEIRERENLPDAGPESHRLYVNAATIPLGEVTRRAQMVQEGAEVVPTSADNQKPPPLKSVDGQVVCGLCGAEGKTSTRGLCRTCEGRRGEALQQINATKEIR